MRMPILFFLTAKAISLIYTSQQATNEIKKPPERKADLRQSGIPTTKITY